MSSIKLKKIDVFTSAAVLHGDRDDNIKLSLTGDSDSVASALKNINQMLSGRVGATVTLGGPKGKDLLVGNAKFDLPSTVQYAFTYTYPSPEAAQA